jgi:GST-like protein
MSTSTHLCTEPSPDESEIDLYVLHTAATANGMRACVALNEFDVPHTTKIVDFANLENRKPDFIEINPVGKIPVLEIKEPRAFIFESGAIVLRCAEIAKSDLSESAFKPEVLSWLFFGCSTLALTISNWYRFAVRQPDVLEGAAAIFLGDVGRLLDGMERQLVKSSWLAGAHFSIADIACYPPVALFVEMENAPTKWPRVYDWCTRVGSRPKVRKGMAEAGQRAWGPPRS